MELDKNIKAFVIHNNSSSLELRMIIYQAKKVQIALLMAEKITVPAKYLNFADIFSEKSANILLEQIRAN